MTNCLSLPWGAGRKLALTLCVASMGNSLVLGAASAQTAQPSVIDPAQLERRFEQPELPKATGEEITPPHVEGAAPPPGAEQVTFVLKGMVVEGSTVFQPGDFLPLYRDQLGTTISVKAIYDLAQAITAKYTGAGYVLSQALVPPQAIGDDGIARIKVIEGYVDKVVILGEVGGPRGKLEEYGDKIRASRPLRLDVLERYLLLASDLPGATASGILKPSERTQGAADLVFQMAHKPVDGYASLDNRGSRYVGPWQSSAGLNLNSTLGLYERTSLQMATTPFQPEELKFGRLVHEQSIGSEGTKISVDGGYIVSHPGYTLKDSAVRSHSLSLGLGASHPLIRSRAENLTVRARLDSRDTTAKQNVTDMVSEDRTRAVRGGATYDWVDTALASPAVSIVGIELSQGLNVLGARSTGSAHLSRSNGHSDFFKVTMDASRVQRLYPGVNLLTALSGQWAGASLLSAEQFSFGGAQFGRGYDPAEITGDHGIAGKLELQYSGPEVSWLKDWQAYGFYDAGRVWQANALAGDNATLSAASTGLGVRANLNDTVSLNAEIAKPLTHEVGALGGKGKDIRGFFGLVARY